jgi:hypothetical protein
MWRRRHQEQVPLVIGCQARHQVMALMTTAPPFRGRSAGVRFIDNHQLRARAQKFVAAAVRLDEIGGDNDIGIHVKE